MSKTSKVDVIINNEQAKASLKAIQDELVKVKTLRDKAMAEGDVKGFNQLNTEFKKLTTQAGNFQKQAFDVNSVLKGMSSASVRELNAAYQIMNKELKDMKRNDPGYAEKQKQVKALKDEMNTATGAMGAQGISLKGLTGVIGGWAAALGVGMSGLSLVKDVMKANEAFTDAWAVATTQAKFAYQTLLGTIATGDWSNFLTNIKAAIKEGDRYQEVLNELEKKQRAVGVREAETMAEVALLQTKSRNPGLDKQTRMDAAQQAIDMERALYADKQKLADEAYANDVKHIMSVTGLKQTQIEAYIKEYDQNDLLIQQSNELLNKQDRITQLRKGFTAWSGTTTYDVPASPADIAKANNLQTEVNAASSAVKNYAITLKAVERGQLDTKFVDQTAKSWKATFETTRAGIDATRRLEITQGRLKKGIIDEGVKDDKAAETSAQKATRLKETAAKESEEAYKLNLDIHKKSVESTIALMQEGTAKELAELKARYDAEKELIKHELETNAKLTPEQKTTLTTTSNNLDTRYETDKNAINKKRLADELQFQKNMIALQLEIAKEGTFGEYNLKKDQIENNRQIELAGITVTGEKKIALEKAINDKFNTQVSKLDQSKNLAVLSQNLYKESGLLNKAYNASRTTLKTQYDQGIITKKQYNDKLYALDAQYQRDILALAVSEAQSKLDILRATGLASIEELQQAQSALDGAVKASTSNDTGKGKNPDAKGKGFKFMGAAEKMDFAVQAAGQTADAIFKIEADKNQRILDDKLGKLQTQREMELDNKKLTEAQKEAINKKFDARERALKAAAWQKQHAADIIQSIVSGALGVLTGLAQAGIPGAILAGIAASAQIVTVASQVQPAFYKGGFTDTAFDDKKTAGVVHANEFVGSAAAVRNPSVKQFFDVIDYAQRTGAIQSLNLPAITSLGSSKPFSQGGYTSANGNTPAASTADVLSVLMENTKALNGNNKALTDIQEKGVLGKWVLRDLEEIQRDKRNIESATDM